MTWLGDAHETMRSPLMNRPHAKILLTAIVGLTVSACAVTPNPFTQGEFESRAKEDRQTLFSDQEPITAPLTLADTMARVLKYNLDRRAKMAEEALALGQLDLDRYALLPELTAKAGYAGRSEHLATNSKSVGSEAPPSEDYTYSADRDVITADLGLTWNVLDFGVSYFNAHQNADRALIMSERRRKAVANLAQEVRFSYWRAAAAQVMRDRVLETVAEAEQALRNAEKVEAEKLRDPFEVLRIQKALLESIRQLETIDSELGTAKSKLAALMNVPPGSDFRLAVSDTVDLHVPDWSIPVERMESLALANNPDLREHDYLSRISIDDIRKEILKIFPGVSFSFSRNYDSNSYLDANRWNNVGAVVSWNLMNVISAPDRIHHAETAEKVIGTKRLALRMAVLAQVHVVAHQFASANRLFERAEKLWSIERRLSEMAKRQRIGGTQNEIERIHTKTSAITAQLRRFQTYAELQLAYGKLLTTIGVDVIPEAVAGDSLPDIAVVIEQRLATFGGNGVETAATEAPPAEPSKPLEASHPETVARTDEAATETAETPEREDASPIASTVSDTQSSAIPAAIIEAKKTRAPMLLAPNPETAYVSEDANVRGAPSLSAEVVDVLLRCQPVRLASMTQESGFRPVVLSNGRSGWVARELLARSGTECR